jgi:DNA-binding transcriptional LysR family regulator
MRLYASRTYLMTHETPLEIKDLRDHRLICQNTKSTQVNAGATLVRELLTYDLLSLLTVNNYFGVLQSVRHGLGIGILPDYVAIDDPDLVRVLPDVESNVVPVFLAYPEELRQSKRIAAFRDFVVSEINLQRKKAQFIENA